MDAATIVLPEIPGHASRQGLITHPEFFKRRVGRATLVFVVGEKHYILMKDAL